YLEETKKYSRGRRSLLNEAERLEASKLLEERTQLLREMTASAQEPATTWETLGLTLFRQGKLAEAEQAFRDGLKRDPDKANLYYYLCTLHITQGEDLAQKKQAGSAHYYRQAVEMAAQAIQRYPQHAQAYFFQGLALERLDQKKEALAALGQAAD